MLLDQDYMIIPFFLSPTLSLCPSHSCLLEGHLDFIQCL